MSCSTFDTAGLLWYNPVNPFSGGGWADAYRGTLAANVAGVLLLT